MADIPADSIKLEYHTNPDKDDHSTLSGNTGYKNCSNNTIRQKKYSSKPESRPVFQKQSNTPNDWKGIEKKENSRITQEGDEYAYELASA